MKKIKTVISLTAVALVLAVVLSGCALTSQLNPTGLKNCVAADTSVTYQTITGWGASSAWWSQTVPSSSPASARLASMLYSSDGIGLTVYRYNIGGGSADLTQEDGINYSPERKTQSFFVADRYDAAKTAAQNFADVNNYDFSRDAQAVNFMKECVNQTNSTVEGVVVFANSPHYLLTRNNLTHADTAYESNLPEENYEAFADYLIQYLNGLVNVHHIPVVSLSPINEPQHKWGGDSASSQEGCHYDPAEAALFLDVLYDKLTAFNEANGTNIKLSPFESGNFTTYDPKSQAMEYIYEMSRYDYFDSIDGLSVHSYGNPLSDESRQSFMYRLNNILPEGKVPAIDMTEVCHMESGVDTGMDSGIYVAQIIDKDMRILSARSWSWWIAASGYDYNDGLVTWAFGDSGANVGTTKRYYVMGQYSSFIKSGDVRVDCKWFNCSSSAVKDLSVSAYSRKDGTVVFVFTNTGKDRSINIAGDYDNMKVVCTDAANSLTSMYEGSFRNSVLLTANSVTTVIVK